MLEALIRKPWMMKVKPKPQRYTAVWSAMADSAAKWKSKVVRKALSDKGKLLTRWRRGASIVKSIFSYEKMQTSPGRSLWKTRERKSAHRIEDQEGIRCDG